MDSLENGGARQSLIGFEHLVELCGGLKHDPEIIPRHDDDPMQHAFGTKDDLSQPTMVFGRAVFRFSLTNTFG